jgi:hypothetical protein
MGPETIQTMFDSLFLWIHVMSLHGYCVQCLARKIWRILLESSEPTNMLQVTSPCSGVQNGFKRMNLKKNKSKWKQFEIYKIDFNYCRFSKTFDIVWKNLKKIRGHSWTSEKNEKNEKKKIKKITARFFKKFGVRHPGVPKGVTLQENMLQLPPVDMQLLWFYFCCYLNLTQITLQNNFNAQSLCIVHSDCARKVFLN